MDLNEILMWLAGMSCGAMLLGSLRGQLRDRIGWAVLSAGILLLMWGLWKARNPYAGIVGGSLWVVFLLIPSIAARVVMRAQVLGNYRRASRAAHAIAILHPFDGRWSAARIARAMELADRGELAAATQILERVSLKRSQSGIVAHVHLLRIERRWDELAQWWRASGWMQIRRFPALLPVMLRAIGETGDLNTMVETFERYKRMLEGPQYGGARAMTRLVVMAMCGRTSAVNEILWRELRDLRDDMKQYWLATAELAAGYHTEGEMRLSAASQMASPFVVQEIAWRRENPPPAMELLEPLLGEILDEDDAHRAQEIRYSTVMRKPWMTRAIVAANAMYFLVEQFAGGTMNERALRRVGVLDPELVRHGQWWRVLTANFMHYGPIHLTMNMVALLALGPYVESSLGPMLYLLAYMTCGIGAMLSVLEAQHLRYIRPDVLLGASGAIMGLIGMMAGILARGWMREKARVAMKRLQVVILVVLMQMLFDWMTPEVSSTAHMAGLIIGLLIGLAMPGNRVPRRSMGRGVLAQELQR